MKTATTTDVRRTAWVLALALGAAVPSMGARQGRLLGKVVDPSGKPIPGVTVNVIAKTIAGFEETMTTDGKGIFMFDVDRIGVTYTYRFEKPGYTTTVVNQAWNVMGTDRQTFTLAPGGEPVPAADLPPPAAASSPAVTAFNEGVRAFETRDYKVATARLEQALRLDPQLRQAWAALARIHLEQKRHREAAEAADKAIALGSTGASILRVRWEAYRQLGDEAKAREARAELEKAGQLEEDAKRIHNEAVALMKIGNDTDAFARFKEAAEIDPSLQVAWLGMGTSGLKIDRAADALAAARKVLEASPAHPEALRLRYNAALKLKDEAEVVDALVALAAIEPASSRDNLYKLARMSFDADQVGEARDRARKVLAMDPNHPHAHYILGVIAVREGAKAEARSHLNAFLRLAPNDPDAVTAKGLLAHIGG